MKNLNNFKYCKNELKLFKKYSTSFNDWQVSFFNVLKLNFFLGGFLLLDFGGGHGGLGGGVLELI